RAGSRCARTPPPSGERTGAERGSCWGRPWRLTRPAGAAAVTAAIVLGRQHEDAFVRDLDRLDRNLVLAGVEVRPFPFGDPAGAEGPLGHRSVGPLLGDGPGEP